MPEARVFNSLNQIDRMAWNDCFIGKIEDYDYLLTVEESAIAGFSWRYLAVFENDKIIAATPFFLTDYKLDTTLQGTGKKMTGMLNKALPNLLTHKLACLGSPLTETSMIGFTKNVKNKPATLDLIIESFEDYAAANKYKLLGLKDLSENSAVEFSTILKAKSYNAMPGMPSAYLDINFKTIDEYLNNLSAKMRKDLRRKMQSFSELQIKIVENIDAILPEVITLYRSTRERSIWKFEELTESYFKNILVRMPGRSFCVLYYSADQLLAANLLIHNEHTLLDKFFCMDERGRDYNLYFLSWLTNIKLCLERGFKCYECGQAYDEIKLRLGSKLSPNTMYFKHRNKFAQGFLKMIAPLFSANDSIQQEKLTEAA